VLSLVFRSKPLPPNLSRLQTQNERARRRFDYLYENDLAFRMRVKDHRDLIPAFMLTRMHGGSGFSVATILRHFFLEYADRLWQIGPHSLPSSFNVAQSFFEFSAKFGAFDLRPEQEYLLRVGDYVDWYTGRGFPAQPLALQEVLQEGVVYSYNAVAPLDDFALETVDSELRIEGIALVRHRAQLSAMVIAGESPPFPPDNEVAVPDDAEVTQGREQLRPHPEYTTQSRYLPAMPSHARVVALCRFDLRHARYDVRYVNLDVGPSYLVLTDDKSQFPRESDAPVFDDISGRLQRYDGLLSALATMIYLPAFVADQPRRVVDTKFATQLHADGATASVRNAVKKLGAARVPFFRTIRCLGGSDPITRSTTSAVVPPDLEFASSGFWRPLAPNQVGNDEEGNPILGQTWVQRTESWTTRSLQTFNVCAAASDVEGPDPGLVYVMRSESHVADLYKIGLTRRTAQERATELSRPTGVPTELAVLAQWRVGNCADVEAVVHQRLARFRVNKRREFFRGNLQSIIAEINAVVVEKGA